MTLQLLRDLSRSTLPLTVNDRDAIDQLRLLRAAGLVAVFLSSPHSPTPFARVLAELRGMSVEGVIEATGANALAAIPGLAGLTQREA